ncbi:hypothetical protein A4D02_17680 [Niastella koreensis]|uniref:ABC3 transporter permease protein domain-containing protein n=1 Tax=Niastella koreensis TaxID=354356 RepID=A0ABX3NLT4_9BACT|nr:ABC transporter permease [Niastella koreensis]OQP39158.1 hypothetical protein A4D02_17680 [Niastella koreensis]
MINFLKVAIRNLTRNKTFTGINILGLALGTVCCLYIIMYVNDQYSYDRQHKSAANIYRINTLLTLQGGTPINNGSCSPPIAPTLKKDFPEVEQFTRIVHTGRLGAKQHLLQYGEKSIFETDAVYADSTFFDVFNYHFVYGNAIKTLDDPYCVVLLQPTAIKLFGNTDPVGKTISINNDYGKHDFKVTAVIDESLGHSHIKANLLMSMNSGGMGGFTYTNNEWAAYNYAASYIRLRPSANAMALDQKLPAFLNKYGADRLKQMGMSKQLHLQPLTSIHTTGGYKSEMSEPVDSSFLHLLLLIAVLIQVIACINFMNLSTAHAAKRAKEVGVRKVIGAQIKNLVTQFLGESLLLSCCGVVLALPLLVLLLPYFNQLTNADIRLSFFSSVSFWLLLTGIMLVSGLLSGSFPAFYLSAFKPIKVLKGNFTNRLSAAGVRRVLVVFQFVLSILLISGIIVIYSQLNFIKNKDVGFNQNQQIILNFYTGDAQDRIPALCDQLRTLSEVKAVSQADNYPSQEVTRDWLFYLEGSNGETGKDISMVTTDEHYAKALGMTIIGGRDFREGDSGRVLLNETGARSLGLNAETAPGKRIYPQHEANEPVMYFEIAGVTKDVNYNSLHDGIKPLMLRYNMRQARANVIINVTSSNYSALLGKIGSIWKQHLPAIPFTYSFLNDDVQKLYEAEINLSATINLFTLMAIFISGMGLFGLSAFSAEQRTKEIGVRKVLGASVLHVSSLLSKDFLKLTLIAFIIATPIAWWLMNQWLQSFSYRINISWWMFALAGSLAMLFTVCVVSVQAIKAALANPVKSLRAE